MSLIWPGSVWPTGRTRCSPRSAEASELAAQYMETSGKMAQVARNLDEAMRIALGAVTREDVICITGSFYLVAEAMRRYRVKTS